jgi:hypothetical protein
LAQVEDMNAMAEFMARTLARALEAIGGHLNDDERRCLSVEKEIPRPRATRAPNELM